MRKPIAAIICCGLIAIAYLAIVSWPTGPSASEPQVSVSLVGQTNSPTNSVVFKLTNHGSQAARILCQSLKSKGADGRETIRAWDPIDERLSAGETVPFTVPDPRVGEPWRVRVLVLGETTRLRVFSFLKDYCPDWLYQRIERHPLRGVSHAWAESDWIEP